MINENESEIDKNILIKQLEDFCDLEKYNIKDLARFLYGNDYLRIFFKNCINKFIHYLDTESELLQLYCLAGFNKASFIKYCIDNDIDDEKICDSIINDIESNCLGVFYAISNDLLKRIESESATDTEIALVKHFLSHEYICKAIDYIIKFYICSNYEQVALHMMHITTREYEIMSLIKSGLTAREIAARLCISENTVKTHRDNIAQKIKDLNIPSHMNLRPLDLIKKVASDIL